MLSWYRALIALRSASQDLVDGDFEAVETQCDPDEQWLIVRRKRLMLVANFKHVAQEICLSGAAANRWRRRLQSAEPLIIETAGDEVAVEHSLTVPGHCVIIFESQSACQSS